MAQFTLQGYSMIDSPRITRDPAVMSGKAWIRGMRVTVGMILGHAPGWSVR